MKPYLDFLHQDLKVSIIKTLFFKNLVKKYNDQVNILVLGIAGENYDGPNLSDSISIFNYNFKTNLLTTISIPRDIWSVTLNDKINSAYAYGEAKKPNHGGVILAKAEISDIVGMPIHYALVIKIDQLKELIDYLGGIEIEVENSFIDDKFPIKGKENDSCNGDPQLKCRYETVIFNRGKNYMSGETALKFIRSRNAQGKEGSDFAREKRQQKVIEGIRYKLIEKIKKLNLEEFRQTHQILDRLIKRDISNQQVAIILRNIFLHQNQFRQRNVSLDEKFFINPPLSSEYRNLWVLVPKGKDYRKIHHYLQCHLEEKNDCQSLILNN
ncbi:MAG: LCP family protein [Patescibacteria group bacterium]|nr:LCP family protein [Patescibacteria group bacterium]